MGYGIGMLGTRGYKTGIGIWDMELGNMGLGIWDGGLELGFGVWDTACWELWGRYGTGVWDWGVRLHLQGDGGRGRRVLHHHPQAGNEIWEMWDWDLGLGVGFGI